MRSPAILFPDAEEIAKNDSLQPSVCIIDINFNRVAGPDKTISGKQYGRERPKSLQSLRPQICIEVVPEFVRNTGLRKQERDSVLFSERGTKPFCHGITE